MPFPEWFRKDYMSLYTIHLEQNLEYIQYMFKNVTTTTTAAATTTTK